jgi:hypothetical protein
MIDTPASRIRAFLDGHYRAVDTPGRLVLNPDHIVSGYGLDDSGLDGADLRELLDERDALAAQVAELELQLARLVPPGICGTTFGVADHPIFICTMAPNHDGAVHVAGGAKAWMLGSGGWTVQRGAAPFGRLDDAALDAPDGQTRAVRALTNATGRMLSRWAEAIDAVRRELWTEVHTRADDVDEQFRDRFADLDARTAAAHPGPESSHA